MLKTVLGTLLGLALLSAPAYASDDPEDGDFTLDEALAGVTGKGDKLRATIKTSMGVFKCLLHDKDAPRTVANFAGLALGTRSFLDPKTGKWTKRPLYDGLIFHRVIPKFMIQGGDPDGNGAGGPGYKLKDETNKPHSFKTGGMMAMANRGPNTAGSQFFITEVPVPFLDDGARPNQHYQIFGKCDNLKLIKKISGVKRGAMDRPEKPVTIEKVTIFRSKR